MRASLLSAQAAALPLAPTSWVRQVKIAFLEHLLGAPPGDQGPSSPPPASALGGALLPLYLDAVREASSGLRHTFTPSCSQEPPGLIRKLRQRILAVVAGIHSAPPHPLGGLSAECDVLLGEGGSLAGMWEERAALLGLRGRHSDALRILLFQLRSVAHAEAYCLGQSPPTFPELARIAAECGEEDPSLQASILAVLSLHADKFRASEALALMPAHCTMAGMRGFLEAALEFSSQAARLALAEVGAASVAQLRAKKELVRMREGRFRVLHKNDPCAVCGRRLGVPVGGGADGAHQPPQLAILPSGAKLHLACKQ